MKKRQMYIALETYKPKRNDESKLICLNCNKLLPKRKRKYCSNECRDEWTAKHYHRWMRSKLIVDRENKCDGCKKEFPSDELILDHITPIACGGLEFDKGNLQILCKYCNKIKTKRDHRKIAEVRHKEKIIIRGQENGQKTIVGFCPMGADN